MIALSLIYYQEWITVLGLSLQLMNLANFNEEVAYTMDFKSTDSIYLLAKEPALFIDFINKEKL